MVPVELYTHSCQANISRYQSLEHHEERVWSIAWNHSGTILASCGEDKSICLWVAEDQKWKFAFHSNDGHSRAIRHVSWSPNDAYLASASFDATVVIWRVTVSECHPELHSIAILEGHANEVKCVAWAPSGHLLATCGRDKSVWIWEFDDDEDCQCVSVLQPHSSDVKSVFWHPFKEIFGSTSYDDSINIYKEELDDWVVACRLTGHSSTVWKADFSPCGQYLVSCSDDKSIKIWIDIPEKKFNWVCFKTISEAHSAAIIDLAWSPCGTLLASCGSDNTICLFRADLPPPSDALNKADDFSTSSVFPLLAKKVSSHDGDVNSICWHPRNADFKSITSSPTCCLASGGDDRLVNLWSIHFDSDLFSTPLSFSGDLIQFNKSIVEDV